MKKTFLKLSLLLALLFVLTAAINMPVFATSEDITNSEEPCNHTSARQEIVKAVANSKNGEIKTICNDCQKTFSSKLIPLIDVTVLSNTSTYTGYNIYPSISLYASGTKISSSDYTVSYKKNGKTVSNVRDAGTYTAVITLRGSYYTGVINRNFTVKPIAVKKSHLSIPNVVYSGKATAPKIYRYGTLLKKDRDYTISNISKNKKYGTYNITLKFKGNYSGTIKTKYTISTAAVKTIKLKKRTTSSITVSWSKVKNATGYKIYRYDYKKHKYKLYKTTSATSVKIPRSNKIDPYVSFYVVSYKKVGKKTYNSQENYYSNVVKPSNVKFTVSSPSKGKIRLSKFNGLSKEFSKCVEFQVSTNKSFNSKKAKVIKGETYLYNYSDKYYNAKIHEIFNLSSKKKYYVRCREVSYDYSGKKAKKICGSWSSVKTIKVK